MKRSLFLGLILISAAMLSVPLAIGRVNGGKENIVITREVLSGDPEAAAGVTLGIPSHWDGHLLWNTEYSVGGEGGAESVFSFLPRQARWAETSEKRISMFFEMGQSHITGPALMETDSRPWALYPDHLTTDELFRRVEEEGESGALTVRIGEYYEYYPVFMGLEGDSVFYVGDYGEVLDYLTKYFHISVGEDRWEITADRAENTMWISAKCWEILGSGQLSVASVSAAGGGGFYFSYYVRDREDGKGVDRGQNRGIFFFPYVTGRLDLTQVRKLCGLPADICPQQMLADQEEGLLYLAVRGAGGYSLHIYRMEGDGLRLEQEIPMAPQGSDQSAENAEETDRAASGRKVSVELAEMSFCEGGILVTWSDNSFCFMVRREGGCENWCQGMFPDPGEWKAWEEVPFPRENACVFDGERLVLAAYERRKSLNVVLAVYGREGQRYGGLYRHSSEEDMDGGFGSSDGIYPQGSGRLLPELILP